MVYPFPQAQKTVQDVFKAPCLLVFAEYSWRGRRKGWVMQNWMKNLDEKRIDDLRNIWGLDEVPRWYRLFGPKWVLDEGVPQGCYFLVIFLACCSH